MKTMAGVLVLVLVMVLAMSVMSCNAQEAVESVKGNADVSPPAPVTDQELRIQYIMSQAQSIKLENELLRRELKKCMDSHSEKKGEVK